MPELIVTNFSKRFTGVSATAAAVARLQAQRHDMALCGEPLPGCPAPVGRAEAARMSATPPPGLPFTIWHVRRNSEMTAALWVRDVLRRPVRIVFTSAAVRRHSALPRWLISRMDAVVATSDAAASFVAKVQAVIPHGVDTQAFRPAPDRVAAWEATGHPGRFGIATIGRIRPEKGTDRFVDAMLRLLPRRPEATALIVGRAAPADRGFLDGLKSRIDSAGLSQRIVFVGEIPPDAMPGLMRSLSAVVQLPRYEGYGMVPLEGMASGVPFAATQCGAYREFSSDGACGFIVPPDDPGSVADALDALIADPARHKAMSEAARRAAETRFSVAAEAQRLADVYDRLWGRN